ncbi:hypothetical protein OK349_18020 [Sphingomonas sp. BT-65]|uniref:hypothetical protein n=1 Tax=Sphingomonas sp. BT-65 TaxID=2989821 RepID=UPI002235B999|nr:hypothetical protein [Sphingomonas sp. BT-65]MCW4463608.1 hypothetical protein [Sphingomonas sp. BT-65]
MKLLATTVAALSISASPVLAQAAKPAPAGAAKKLSLSNTGSVRASTAAGDSNQLTSAILIGVLATVAIIGGIIVLADNDDDPDSP